MTHPFPLRGIDWPHPTLLTLAAKYPRLFQNLESMSIYVEPGWYSLIDETLARIDRLLDGDHASRFSLVQAKEKFGSLRFYYDYEDIENTGPERMSHRAEGLARIVREAEAESRKTCQVCGKPGRLAVRSGTYITTCGCPWPGQDPFTEDEFVKGGSL